MSGAKHKSILTAQQWVGVVIVLVLLTATILVLKFVPRMEEPQLSPAQDSVAQVQGQEIMARTTKPAYKPKYPKYKRDTVPLLLQPFDPNTADSITFLQLGWKPWMVRTTIKYRNSGKVWCVKSDLKSLYGMTDSLYAQIEPYIMLPDSLPKDTTIHPVMQYISNKKDTVLELNSCDTSELKMLRGIGSYYAKMIVQKRERMGGYYSVNQLSEIKGLDAESLKPFFHVDTSLIVLIPINHVKAPTLGRHPYIGRYEKAQTIYDARKRQFKMHSMDDIRSLNIYSEDTLQHLSHYLSFQE